MFGVGLYCFGALRGLWGFCVREWLGGLEACGVFALRFASLLLLFILLSGFRGVLPLASRLACSAAFLALWVGCCFFFPYGCTDKRRAQFLASSLVLLWACLDVLKHYRYLLRFIVAVM